MESRLAPEYLNPERGGSRPWSSFRIVATCVQQRRSMLFSFATIDFRLASHAYTRGDVGKVRRRDAVLPAAGSQPQRICTDREQCKMRLLADSAAAVEAHPHTQSRRAVLVRGGEFAQERRVLVPGANSGRGFRDRGKSCRLQTPRRQVGDTAELSLV